MKRNFKNTLANSNPRQLITTLAFCLCILGQGIKPSQAEGSKELIAKGGYRPYLAWSSNVTLAGIPFKTTLKVYVEQGEIVYLGSSVHNNTQDIVYRSPFNGQNSSCNVLNTGSGFIDTLEKESKGPAPLTPGGYTPCQFTATETGIYEVEFRSQTPGSTSNPTPVTTTTEFSGINQRATVAAWDITVSRNGVAQTGRVFTNYVALNMGENAGINGAPSDVRLNSQLFIQTKDGYRYRTEMNGLDPFGFIFFANSRGYVDSTNNSTLYHSITSPSNNTLNFDGNVKVQRPDVLDTATDITHLVFFNSPATETLVAVGIPLTATPPVIPQNFLFTGGTGGSGNQTFVGVGGNFSFNATSGGSYQIIIDTNTDGIFDPSVDRVLQNVMLSGQNVVPWDGKDANGVNLPSRTGNQPYNAQITTRGGEYHFPLLDAENNSLGFKITMENPPEAFPNFQDQNGQNIGTSTVYYNDSNYTTANGTPISLDGTGATSPRNASRGINSAGGEHEFSSRYGDYKGIDTWTFFPSQAVFSTLVITSDKQANVKGSKSIRFLTDNDSSNTLTVGDTIQYTITYSNLNPGNSDAINFVINDTLPNQLTYVSAAITSATTGNNITLNPSYNGSGVLTNSGTLRVGDAIAITITATINNANNSNAISNQASATFSTPDNPSATAGTVLTDADSAGSNTNLPSVGGYVIQIANDGVNTGNSPSNTGDDEPTLFIVGNTVKYTVSPLAGKVIINEVLYNETTNNNDEFIELYNASSSAADLSGFKLSDGNLIANDTDDSVGGFNYTFPSGTVLQPGQYAVIWIGSQSPNTETTDVAFQAWAGQVSPRLNNSGDDVWLYDSQNQIIDYVAYGRNNGINTPPPSSLNLWDSTYQSSLAGSTNGRSISLTRNGNDTNTSACWEITTSNDASSRCPNFLQTKDTEDTGSTAARITSVGENNNGTAKLILVKRITRINNQDLTDIVDGVSNVPTSADNYVAAPRDVDDNDSKWPSGYLRGKINAGAVKSGDEVEYTIYFLSKGSSSSTNVKFCDLVPANSTFVATAFNSLSPNDGVSGGDQGIALAVGSATPTVYFSNVADSDRGAFYAANDSSTPTYCGSNTNGSVVVSITKAAVLSNLPGATGQNPTPANSYGFVRFRVKIK